MICRKSILSALFLCCFYLGTAQYIQVDDSYTAKELVENVLVNSSCITVSNSTEKGDLYTPNQKSYGFFKAGTSAFPLQSGIFLSTSSSATVKGPFVSGVRGGGDSQWGGDRDLDQILGISSVNTTALEFDFTALTNFISFNYIFASNEYQYHFPCVYSDGFAFLIKEKGSSENYSNLAVIPATAVPVSSIKIHPKINSSLDIYGFLIPGCDAVNEAFFNGYNPTESPLNFAGQTKVMNAQTTVIPGKTYHVKLVIADDDNAYFDSAVFVEAGSFDAKIDLGVDRTIANKNPICYGDTWLIDTKQAATNTYKWYKNGVELPLEKSPSYQVTDSGVYKVDVILATTCTVSDDIKIEFTPQIVLQPTTLIQCDTDADGKTIFDLTKVAVAINNNSSGLLKIEYYPNMADAQTDKNTIANPTNYTNTNKDQIAVARVTNSFGCVDYEPIKLVIATNQMVTPSPISTCDTDAIADGLAEFDLDAQVTPTLLYGLPSGLLITYYLSASDATLEQNAVPNLFKNTIPYQQTLYARIINAADCYGIIPITIKVILFDPPNFQDETKALCEQRATQLTVAPDFLSYLWNTGEKTNAITVNQSGNYSVTVTNGNGCKRTKKYTLKPSGVATITNVTSSDFKGQENTVLIAYTGTGNYEFSLDGVTFQDNPLFTNVAAGHYFAYAKDKNGCGLSAPYTVYVLDYPHYFTPNGDGINDNWNIQNWSILPDATGIIFDRYGKLIYEFSNKSSGWNGIFNGVALPADDYWFTLKFADGGTTKGHFSLKR
ncbi:T9SS type B sorting domain-containing protein [Flavobacterium restrictum]|uniref:T9SS type B sorting domain-containing protein n=1 Tax=Flavobacterium restrictum TaxID=2594428 RepID=A0A553E8E1_9FLAO|nr:T9SS type B sorting domain-containing protein [Flavobacterium restrictum]TRX41338.1 T9SS type B sorting domain-containing protein [Flavobacterium restrictum]